MKIKGNIFTKRIPTILGVIILIGGLIAGILLVGKPQSLLTKAGPTSVPKNVRISNQRAESITIGWTTDVPVTGLIKYSDNPGNLSMPGADVRDQVSGEAGVFTTHYVVLTNLEAGKTYYFEIVSGSASYNDSDRPYQVRTGLETNLGTEDIINGKIVSTASQGVEGAMVYIEIDGGEALSALTKSGGVWQLDLGQVRNDKGQVITYDRQGQQVSLFVQGGALGTATALTNTANDNPVGDIAMGTNVNLVEGIDSGQAGMTQGSGLAEGAGFGSLADEELLNPLTDGEKIATSSPEFRGKLPTGTKLTITVESEIQTATFDVGDEGVWVWTPPVGLEPGEHTVSIEYEDEQGILQKIVRSFTVLAAEEVDGLPAFTATGSADPAPTASPSAIPTVVEASGSSMPSTESGVPDAGVLTTTYWLLIVGLGLFLTGQISRRWIKTI
ncbi:fibronectin type III domain-containing protein [Patescibacteria group bacterium]|nr:fibronectin type III domain-containing protein [Patescibacteria group bacterium]